MDDDIENRLRDADANVKQPLDGSLTLYRQAADEIARLRQWQDQYMVEHKRADDAEIEIERLRAEIEEWNGKHQLACLEIERLRADNKEQLSVLRSVLSALETLGEDGWSEAPYLMRKIRAAIARVEGRNE